MATHAQARRLAMLQQRMHGKHASYVELKALDNKKVKAFEVLLLAGINPLDGSRRRKKFASSSNGR